MPLASRFGGWPFNSLGALMLGVFARPVHLTTLTWKKNVQNVPYTFCQSGLCIDSFCFARPGWVGPQAAPMSKDEQRHFAPFAAAKLRKGRIATYKSNLIPSIADR